MAKSINLFTKYQLTKLTMEKIDMYEFMYLEQQKSADFVDERTLSKATKIDIESILESLGTEQEEKSEYEQRPCERDIVMNIKRMGAAITSASTHLYKSRVKMKGRPKEPRSKECLDRRAAGKSRLERNREGDNIWRKETYGSRVTRKYAKRQQSTLYREDKEGRVQVETCHSEVRHSKCRISVTKYEETGGSKRGCEEHEALRQCVQVRRDYVGGGTGKDLTSPKLQTGKGSQERLSMANHSMAKAKAAPDDCAREGKRVPAKVANEWTGTGATGRKGQLLDNRDVLGGMYGATGRKGKLFGNRDVLCEMYGRLRECIGGGSGREEEDVHEVCNKEQLKGQATRSGSLRTVGLKGREQWMRADEAEEVTERTTEESTQRLGKKRKTVSWEPSIVELIRSGGAHGGARVASSQREPSTKVKETLDQSNKERLSMANHPTAKAKAAPDDCARDVKRVLVKVASEMTERKVTEHQRKGKRKGVTWDPGTMEDTDDGVKGSAVTTAKRLNEVAGTEAQVDNGRKVTQLRGQPDTDGKSLKDNGRGPMDKYVTAAVRPNQQKQAQVRSKDSPRGKVLDPANPRKRPNRRTRRLHLQLHKAQAQPTLNWYGFKSELEERKVQSADFAEEITYEAMESLYKVEDFTIIGIPRRDEGTGTGATEGQGSLSEGVRIVSLNIRTLTKHKLPVLAWYIRKYEVDCLMLQDVGCTETELRYHRADLKRLIGSEAVITISPAGQQGGEDGHVGGLMTIIQTRLGLKFVNHREDKLNLGLIQISTCSLGGQQLNFINSYWPVENKEGPHSLWNVTLRELRLRGIKGTPLQYVQDTILRDRDKLLTETPGSLVLIGGDLNSTIRKEERGGRTTPLDKWIVESQLVSVRESLTGDDTSTRDIEKWATHYVGLDPTSIIDHFLIHGNGWEDQVTCYGVDQNLDFSNYTDHRPILCVIVAGPKKVSGETEAKDRRAWAPVIKHKDLVGRFQKKLEKWHTSNAIRLGTLQVSERYTEVTKAIRDIGLPLADRSRKRLEEKRAAYKHGWSPEYVATKARMDFLLEVRRILRCKGLCEEAVAERVREAARRWEGVVRKHMHEAEDQDTLLGGDHGLRFWRTATVLQMTGCYLKDYEDVKRMLHGKRREAMRMEMGGHIQRREERRAEGKLKKVIDSILKKTRVNLDLSCFVDADGVLQTDSEQGHIKLTQDFAAWYNTPLGHVDNESLFMKPWEEICQGREEYKNNLASTQIPADLQDLFWEAIMHTPRRREISCRIKEELAVPPTYDDFITALQATKDSSAPGPSQITYGMIKQLPQVILQEVYQLLCDIWEGRLTPEEWKLKWQQPIPKKVDSGTGICRMEDFRPLGLVDTFRKLWSKIIVKRIQMVWEETGVARTELQEDHIQSAQHGFRAHRGTDTALSQLVNAMEQAEQMDTSIGISSFDIRRAFDSVSKGLIHLGWVRLGVPDDVVRWLQAMDEEALTIVRTPFALEIHNSEGIEGLWKAIHEGRLAAFMAERGTAQGDVTSPATWMCVFDILLTMLELSRLTHRFYIRHGSELSPVKPIAYADDLVAVMADVLGLQQVSRVVSGFCVICNLTILPAKLRTYCHNFGGGEVSTEETLITYHGKDWRPVETRVRGHMKEDGPLKYLGVLTDLNNSYEDLYHSLEERIAQHCGLVTRARASGVTKATVAQASVLRSIEYAAVWANWTLERYRKLDKLFTDLLKSAARNMRSHPALALYMSRETLGQGFLRFSDEVQFRKWTFLQRAAMGHRDIRRTGQSLLDHVAARVQVDTVTGRYRYMVRQHRDVTEVWGGSLMEWLKEAGYGIYVHGARVETGANEPIHDGMARLEQSVRTFLETYNVHVWGDLISVDSEDKPQWDAPQGMPDKLRELMLRKTPPEDGIHLRAGQYWCVKTFGTESWTIVEIMGADADRPYFMHCRYWQTMDMSRMPDIEEVIYPLNTLHGAGTNSVLSWDRIFATTECWQIITGDDIICGEILTRPIKRILRKAPPLAVWIQPLPPPAVEQTLRHWMQKAEYCVSGMSKKRTADSILLRDNPKLSRCVIATVTSNERQRPTEAIRITVTSGEDVSNQDMEILGACLTIRFHQGTNPTINSSMKTTGQYLSQRQIIRKGKRNALTAMMEGWLPAMARIGWTPALKGTLSPWKRQMTDKGMHIVRYMADGGTVRSCNILETDMQEVLMCLLQPGQPMIIQANNGTLVLGNLHQIMDDHRLRLYQHTRDNYAEKAGRRRKFTDANFRLAAKLHQLPKLTMQRAATVIRLALQKRWQGENLVKGGRQPTEPRSQWYCDACKCVDSQEHWLTQCKRGQLAVIRKDCLRKIREIGTLYPKQIRKGIRAIEDYLCGGLDCGVLWTGVLLRHHMVKLRRFMSQTGISFSQQAEWEEAIVTVLAHTVQSAWKMLAEHERLITTGGADTGHHGLRPGSPPRLQENGTVQEATWMDRYLKRSHPPTPISTSKRPRKTRLARKQKRVPQLIHVFTGDVSETPRLITTASSQTTMEEQNFVREHYGDDFICFGEVWTERMVMRLCTGQWYNNYIISAVIEALESEQRRDQRYCVTKWELEKWTDGRRLGRLTVAQQRNSVLTNYVVNHDNMHWGLLISLRTGQSIDIMYADSLRWSGREWTDRFKRWWMQIGRQEQTTFNLIEHELQLPVQTDTVECGVFTTCYHQAIFELSQDNSWRNQDKETKVRRLKEVLGQVTPEVAARKRRDTRETLYRHGHRLATQVEAQLGPLLIDLVNKEEEEVKQRSKSTRKRKASETADSDITHNHGRIGMKRISDLGDEEVRQGRRTFGTVGTDKVAKLELQEGALRQGRKIYDIWGSTKEGYEIRPRETAQVGIGPLNITETEEEDPRRQTGSAEEALILWTEIDMTETDLWDTLNDYMMELDTQQLQVAVEDIRSSISHEGLDSMEVMNNNGDSVEEGKLNIVDKGATTPRDIGPLDSTLEQKSDHKVQQTKAGKEESKEDFLSTNTGAKRKRRRRSQLEALCASIEHPKLEKRARSVVDYTPTLDKEDTKVAAKDIKTLSGSRHQSWRVGYARSTINKVLAPGQDAGYGLFATAQIECNDIICTYEGASVDYEEAVSNRYRSHYLMTCPSTRRAIDAADFNSCYGRLACDPLDKALYNAICWSHTIPMVLRAITTIRSCYEIFWFYGDLFPWPSELLQQRARKMVLDQGWALPKQQDSEEEEEDEAAAPLDITDILGSDFVVLPEVEMRYTYQDAAMTIEQLHEWGDKEKFADVVGPRAMASPGKGSKRRKPEKTEETPKLLSPTDARAWANKMTSRIRCQLPGPWIRIPTETQKFWPVAFATDTEATEAQVGVVVTRTVTRFEIICDWEGTSRHIEQHPTGYDPECIYDAQTGTAFRLDGLSYGPWVVDPLNFDKYNAVHVWLPENRRYVTIILCTLPAGMAVYAPKGYLHWRHHPKLASTARSLYQTWDTDLRTFEEGLGTGKIIGRLSRKQGLIDDLGMNVLAWTTSQLQGEHVRLYSNENLLESYDWERLLRWKGRGPDSPGVSLGTPRTISLADAWIWFLCYPPNSKDPYRYEGEILELPMRNGTSPVGIGLDETNDICACFAAGVPEGTVIEQLDGECLNCCQSDIDSYHPYHFPDINLGVKLTVTSPGRSLLRYAQDAKDWNRYNACYMYRHNQLHLLTLRNVERGEKLLIPKGAAHWQGQEDGLLYEGVYATESQRGSSFKDIAERFRAIRSFNLETGTALLMTPYQKWTEPFAQVGMRSGGQMLNSMDFDALCLMYFRLEKGLGSVREGSQSVYDVFREEERDFPPFGPD